MPDQEGLKSFILLFLTEKATDGSLQSEDWTLNMEICDIINETEEGYVLLQQTETFMNTASSSPTQHGRRCSI